MANVNAVWGIDVGQCALKALRLQQTADGTIEVTHFDIIEHPKILSQPDTDAEELIRNALDKFLSRNEIGDAKVALAVPGQSSFARFIKLPPVEPKRIPEIVRFEAVQQIPFDIEEVEWDYQTFISPRSPDVEVGIFAMRKELVFKHLSNLRMAGIEADVVQLAPLALYNMMVYDELTAKTGATILIDVGAENTDLVISDGDRIWLRSIPLGGNNFTESLVKAFKLPFSKAESLKRTAATSKYARQIFVAMRPVFGDLVSEVQRSIGFYTSLHRDATISRVLCLGNAFRLPGLQKYLEQNLQVEAVRPNAFNRLKPSPTINAPAFAENVLSFGVAYGLGLQGLGASPIRSNLLPLTILKQRKWRAQRPWFGAAAALMVFGVVLATWFAGKINASVKGTLKDAQDQSKTVLALHEEIQRQVIERQGKGRDEIRQIQEIKQITGYRDAVLQVMYLVQNSLPNDWRGVAEDLAAGELKKPIDQISWRGDVLPLLKNKPALRDRIEMFLVEQVKWDLYVGRPPAANAAVAGGGVGGGSAVGVTGGVPPPPTGGGALGPGTLVSPPATGAPAGGTQATAAGKVIASGDKYVRITVIGTTNMPVGRIAGEVRDKFLNRMLNLKKQDKLLPRSQQLLAGISLDEQDVYGALKGWTNVVPEANWPKPAEAGASGAAPAEAKPVSLDQMGLENYKDMRFTIVFDVKMIPPADAGAEEAKRAGLK